MVCLRDGVLCLLFRVANLRMSHVIEAHVRATVVSHKVTEEGEIIPYHQKRGLSQLGGANGTINGILYN